MKNLRMFNLNSQQDVIVNDDNVGIPRIIAFSSKHNEIIVIHPDEREHTDEIKRIFLDRYQMHYPVIYGDSLQIDTWDNQAREYGRKMRG